MSSTFETERGDGDDSRVEVVEAVSDATGRSLTEPPPLQRSVDADALEAVVSGERSSTVQVAVEYAGARVRVDRRGVVATSVDPPR